MRQLLSKIGLAHWWGLLTVLIFLIPEYWLRATAEFMRESDWFRTDREPFNWLPTINEWIDVAVRSAIQNVKFDPAAGLIFIGPMKIPNLFLALILGIFLLALAFVFYRRAVATKGIRDDLMALAIIYLVLRLEGNAGAALNLPIIGAIFREQQSVTYLLFLSVFLLLVIIGGKGGRDSKIFWKGFLEGVAIWLLFLPKEVANAIAQVTVWIADGGHFLRTDPTASVLFPIVWAVIGIILVVPLLYSVGRLPPPEPSGKELVGKLEEMLKQCKKW